MSHLPSIVLNSLCRVFTFAAVAASIMFHRQPRRLLPAGALALPLLFILPARSIAVPPPDASTMVTLSASTPFAGFDWTPVSLAGTGPLLEPIATLSYSDVNGEYDVVFGGRANPSPAMTLTSTATTSATFLSVGYIASAQGSALHTYSFQILGPDAIIPLHVFASGFASISNPSYSSGGSIASAYAGINFGVSPEDPNYGNGSFDAGTLGGGPGSFAQITQTESVNDSDGLISKSFVLDNTFTAATNTIYRVNMNVGASAQALSFNSPSHTTSATVYVDPMFEIALSGPERDLYTIVLSQGMGNSASVPEGGVTAAFMVPILLLVGLFRCRSRVANRTAV